jgi:hypothetical protein
MFEENGKSGSIVRCHETRQQGKPVDLAVTVRVATKQ